MCTHERAKIQRWSRSNHKEEWRERERDVIESEEYSVVKHITGQAINVKPWPPPSSSSCGSMSLYQKLVPKISSY